MQYDGQSPDQRDPQPDKQPASLAGPDMEAIDRIFGGDPESFIPESDRDHAAMNLLDLLRTPVESEHNRLSRVDLIQILASRIESGSPLNSATLSEADRLALDAYIEQGYAPERVSDELRPRATRCDHIAGVLTRSAPSPRGDLVERTLSRIQEHIDQEAGARDLATASRGFSIRWSDLISVAAVLLLVASVALPIMSGMRSSAQQNICFDNMRTASNAFGMYSGSNRDMLPMATAGLGPTWMDVGSTPERSNSSNLYTLIRTDNAHLADLACPSNPYAPTGKPDPDAWDWKSLREISYSYRIMPPGGMKATAPQPVRVVLLADRSPVVLRVAKGLPFIPEENSPNHRGAGQHMLMLDGSSKWTTSPVIKGQDNIWLPRPIEQVIHQARSRLGIIKGSELPDGPTDAFVGP